MHRIKKDSLFLIDGSSLLYRSFYGLRPLHTIKGVPTQATYGFCRSMKKLIDDFDPQHLLILWDTKGKTFRSDIYDAYKATRQAPPNDLFLQKEHIMQFADLAKIPQLFKTGYEADDLIYSIIMDHKNKDFVIVGPDKDLHQLIAPNVLILDPMKKEVIDEKAFFTKHGFEPKKLSFYHAIVGDTSDNIPGVRGIGEKGASELVQQFDSLDDLYNNLDKVKKDRTRNALEAHKDDAYLSLKLFTLKHVELPYSLKEMRFDKENWSNANDLFEELEFSSLIVPGSRKEAQTSFLESQAKPSPVVKKNDWTCIIVRTKEQLADLIEKIKEKKFFALDTETTGLSPIDNELVGLSIAYDAKKSYYIPFIHKEDHQLNREETLAALHPIFSSHTIKKTFHHAKFDELVLLQYNTEINNVAFDTLLAANLLRKEWTKIGLKKLSLLYLNEKMDEFADILGKEYSTFAEVPIPQAAPYACHDALQTFKLTKILQKELGKEKTLKKIFDTIELPLCQVLLEMENTGMAIDLDAIHELNKVVSHRLSLLEKKIVGALEHKHIKHPESINLNSPKQIETLLFDDLKLPVVKKSSTGQRSTDQEVLIELSKQHPVPGLILQYRELFKLKSTYLDTLPLAVSKKTHRIHTNFSQTMVATGRLSSSEPNLQNIPAGGDFGIQLREAFIAPRGKTLLSADYSQIELRVLAHLTKDKTLTEAFLHNEDIHALTAAELFGIPPKEVTNEQRQIGKRINFSIMYGLTPYGLSKDLGIKPSEAKEYIEKYFAKYPKVAHWMDEIVDLAKKTGYTETILGRRRYIPGLTEKNKTLYEAARRTAINSPVQGTSAELMKLAMIRLNKALKGYESKIILQIHDELLLECPADELELVKKLVKKEMESVAKWEIPLTVNIRTGKNWGEITK